MNRYEIKEKRKEQALKHNAEMNAKFKEEIEDSIKGTKEYKKDFTFSKTDSAKKDVKVEIVDAFTQDAVEMFKDGCCILNFASFTRGGGGYMKGSTAQEEALCHASTLFQVLSHFQPLYDANRENIENTPFYEDWALYSPNVIFNNDCKVNVVTCAAPNLAYLIHHGKKFSRKEFHNSLFSRIKFALDVMEENNEKNVILGAFGCGAFGNDPHEVAYIFKELLPNYSFERIVFAIPSTSRNDNFEVFSKIL